MLSEKSILTTESELLKTIPSTKFTRFTSEGLLTKAIHIDALGNLHRCSHATMSEGTYETIDIYSVVELAEQLDGLTFQQAVSYGVGSEKKGKICTKSNELCHLKGCGSKPIITCSNCNTPLVYL